MRFRVIGGMLVTLLAFSSHAQEFKLESPDVGPDKELGQEFIYNAFGCTGDNQSFALKWSDAPPGTKSFAVTHFDPDAMRGRGFWHWFVVNIPASITELPRDSGNVSNAKLPKGAQQLGNNFRKAGFSGSCPPMGDKPHHYEVTVYALKVAKLKLPADATAEDGLPLVEANALAKATLGYTFARKR